MPRCWSAWDWLWRSVLLACWRVPAPTTRPRPSIGATALYGAIPLILAIVALIVFGIETKRKQLERITAEELHEEIPATVASV